MVMKRSQSKIFINNLSNLFINKQVHMDDLVVNYVLRPFEGNIPTEDPQGIKLYLYSKRI